jgi:hypothetical protein
MLIMKEGPRRNFNLFCSFIFVAGLFRIQNILWLLVLKQRGSGKVFFCVIRENSHRSSTDTFSNLYSGNVKCDTRDWKKVQILRVVVTLLHLPRAVALTFSHLLPDLRFYFYTRQKKKKKKI